MIREKATLRELSDRLQAPTAVDADGAAYVYGSQPSMYGNAWGGSTLSYRLDDLFDIDYTGDWRDSLHSPQHQYVEGELVVVWDLHNIFAQVRKVAEVKDGVMYTLFPGRDIIPWDHHRKYDESLLGDPIAEWPEKGREDEDV